MPCLRIITGTAWLVSVSAFVSPLCKPGLTSSPDTGRYSTVEATRQSWTLRHPTAASRRLALLECAAQSAGGIDKAPTLAGVPQGEGFQRVYETWRWRDHEINFRVEGPKDAPPILLIHGFGASVGHFRKNIPVLVSEGYRVYAVDLLGFGASDKPKDVEFSLELWQEMLTEFITEKSRDASEQWVVMGNSIGGLLTLMLTESLQGSRKVRGSVLFNTAGGLVSFRESELPFYMLPVMWFFNNVVFGPFFGPKFFANFRTEDNVRSVLKQVYCKDVVDDELVKMLITPSDDEGACEVFLKVFTGPPGPTPASLLKNIKDTKVLALWGEADPWTPLNTGTHAGASLGQHLETFELVVLPETGHCPHDESPEECHEALLPWLKALA
eukprot:jgi/Undpi1/1026/HiC_scaffold_10.g04490.m1